MKENFLKMHYNLRKYRYHYYELHENLVSDYDYDMLEKDYDNLADALEIPRELRVSNFVGFDIRIPINPYNLIKNE